MVVLEPLLAGESLVSTVCNFGVIRTLESDRMTLLRVPPLPAFPTEMVLGTDGHAAGGGRDGEAGGGSKPLNPLKKPQR